MRERNQKVGKRRQRKERGTEMDRKGVERETNERKERKSKKRGGMRREGIMKMR